jgi:hypothetical protein
MIALDLSAASVIRLDVGGPVARFKGASVFRLDGTGHGLKPFGPPLLGVRDDFGSVFEMHRVEVKPFSAPDELMTFKQVDDFDGDAVPPDELAFLGFRPEPATVRARRSRISARTKTR